MNYYSPKEAAKLLNLPLRTIQHRCQQQDVLKQFGRYRISEDLLEEWGYISEKTLDEVADSTTQPRAKDATRQAQESATRASGSLLASVLNEGDSMSAQEMEALRKENAELKARLSEFDEVDHIEGFTSEQYNDFLFRLKDYQRLKTELQKITDDLTDHIKDLRNERDYLRGSLDSAREQMDNILQQMQQRNFIEAKEKGLDSADNAEEQ